VDDLSFTPLPLISDSDEDKFAYFAYLYGKDVERDCPSGKSKCGSPSEQIDKSRKEILCKQQNVLYTGMFQNTAFSPKANSLHWRSLPSASARFSLVDVWIFYIPPTVHAICMFCKEFTRHPLNTPKRRKK